MILEQLKPFLAQKNFFDDKKRNCLLNFKKMHYIGLTKMKNDKGHIRAL